MGIFAAIGIDHFNHMKRPDRTDLQMANIECAGIVQKVVGIQLKLGDTLCNRHQALTSFAQVESASAAEEQFHIVLPFQCLYLGRQRRLTHAQGTCRSTETAISGDRKKGTKLRRRHL